MPGAYGGGAEWARALLSVVAAFAKLKTSRRTAAERVVGAIGTRSISTGDPTVAVGQDSVASGSNSTALGQAATASGSGAVALGQGASAAGTNSIAIGQGAVATGPNQIVLGGPGTVIAMPNAVTSAARANQNGPTYLLTSDGAGNVASTNFSVDQLTGRLDRLDRRTSRLGDGVAIAMALGGIGSLPEGKRFALSAAHVGYDGHSGFGVGAVFTKAPTTASSPAAGSVSVPRRRKSVGGRPLRWLGDPQDWGMASTLHAVRVSRVARFGAAGAGRRTDSE
jgi:hypothetical protein